MLQGGSRHRELHRSLGVLAGQQGVDQAAAEAVTAADTVDDVQMIQLGEAVLILGHVVKHGAPVVVKGRFALAQRDGDHLEIEFVRQLFGHALIAFLVQLAAGDVGVLGLDAEYVFGILLVGDAHVYILAQLRHGGAGFVARPQLAAVVQVAADLHAVSFRGLAGLLADLHHIGAQRRGDAGEVEPLHALKNGIPVEISRSRLGNGGMGAVINAHAGTLGSALLVEVDAHTVAAAGDLAGVHTVAAQAVHRRLADGVGGQLGDVSGVQAIVGQADGHVGLTAAESEFQVVGLDEALVVIGLQADHQLAEGNNFLCHEKILSCLLYILSAIIKTLNRKCRSSGRFLQPCCAKL